MFSNFRFLDNFIVELTTSAGTVLYFSLEPYLDLGDFTQLKNLDTLTDCKFDELGGLNWSCGVSLSADTLMINSYKK